MPPRETSAVVLSLDVADENSPRTPPLISLFADGRMTVRASQTSSQILSARMSRADLEALTSYVIDTERFTGIETAAIETSLDKPPPDSDGLFLNSVADAPTSFLKLSVPGCTHSVKVEGSALRSMSRPDIDALQRFRRIEVRLLKLASSVQLNQ